MRYVLCEQYGFTNPQIKFGYSDYGKPYIVEHHDIHYNISHSGSWVLCAIGGVPLGIDVEFMKDKKIDITGRVFSKEENDFINSQFPENNKIRAFHKLWTLK